MDASDKAQGAEPAARPDEGLYRVPGPRLTKARAVLLAGALVVALLTLFLGVFALLSRGFGSLAREAATSFGTDLADADAGTDPPLSPGASDRPARSTPPAVPGL